MALTQCSLVLLLSACGSGGSDGTPSAAATGNTSLSAAQLAADDTTSLSVAQAAAAGLVPVASVETNTETDAVVDSGVDEAIETAKEQEAANTPAVGAAQEADNGGDSNNVDTTDTSEPESIPDTVAIPTVNTDNDSAGAGNEQNASTDTDTSTTEEASTTEDTATVEETNTADTTTDSNNNLVDSDTETSSTDNSSGDSNKRFFTATTTEGFTGEVLDDGTVEVKWQKDPTARGYNLYRQAEYVTTVFGETYIDEDIYDESYYYEIQAFDFDENYNYVAKGLTVDVNSTGRTNPDSPKKKENLLDGYELVFSEEFNGTELDKSKWVTSYLWGDELVINSEEQHYVDIVNKPDFGFDPFIFDGESLTIRAIKTPDNLKEKAFGQPYLSGVITSYDSFKFTYGYVEARAQLPFGQGLWPAFWLLNAYYVDDKPEIDIMEFIGDNQDVVYHNYHYYDSNGELRSTHSEASAGVDYTTVLNSIA